MLAIDAHHRVRAAIARRAALADAVVERLLDDEHGRVRAAAVLNGSVRLLTLADRWAVGGPRSTAAGNELLRRLRNGHDASSLLARADQIVAVAAAHGHLTVRQRWTLAGRGANLRQALAMNPDIGVVAWRLSRSDNFTRAAYASNPNASPWVLATMSMFNPANVRRQLAENPRAAKTTLLYLSQDVRWDVRRCVAANPRAPAMARFRLSRDPREIASSRFDDAPRTAPSRSPR